MPSWHNPLPEMLPEFVTLTASDGVERSILTGRERTQLERDVLPAFLPLQRWYGAKQEGRIRSVTVNRIGSLGDNSRAMTITETKAGAAKARYFLPLSIVWGEDNLKPGAPLLPHTLAKARKGPRLGAVVDGAFDDGFAFELMAAIRGGKPVTVENGALKFDGTAALRATEKPTTARRLGVEQSNVSVVLDEKVMLKIYRRLQTGLQPDVEVGRFLSETAGFTGTPPYLGSAAFVENDGEIVTLATAFAFVFNQGDAWSGLLDALDRDLEQVRIAPEAEGEPFAYPLNIARVLGVRTAELHLAFATPTDDPAFNVEPIRKADLKSWSAAVAREARSAFGLLREQVRKMPEEVAEDLDTLLAARDDLIDRIRSVELLTPSGGKSRIHGDYHLGQVLICQDDVMIVDFEGEPQRGIDERRAKSSPLRDTAGMLRSFDYLAWAALERRRGIAGAVEDVERRRAMQWRDQAGRDYLDAYFGRLAESPAPPAEDETARGLLRLFTIQKALYEIGYEAANRPGWISIPVRGIVELLRQKGIGA